VALPLFFFGNAPIKVLMSVSLCSWVLLSIIRDVYIKVRTAKQGVLAGFGRLSRSYYGMQLAHIGILVTILGVTFTANYSVERDVRMGVGDSVNVGPYHFDWQGIREIQGANYRATQAEIKVSQDGELVSVLHPEKRIYVVQNRSMTEAAIDSGLFRDVYVAMGEPLDNNEWAVRVYYKPFVRWLWLGALMMAAGGVLAMSDRRYRIAARQASSVVSQGVTAK
jgi:cytochrome c-type biogenesis protein CcmF